MSHIAELTNRLRLRTMQEQEPNRHGGWDTITFADPDCDEAANALDLQSARISALEAEIETLTAVHRQMAQQLAEARDKSKNLQAALTSRAKTMLKARDKLINARDELEDEGDRVYFGSTNDADTFKDFVEALDNWAWNDIMADGELPDVYAACREANSKLEAMTKERDEARDKALEEAAAACLAIPLDGSKLPYKACALAIRSLKTANETRTKAGE